MKKIGVFPIGYRKSKNQPISERAIKHLDELGNNLENGTSEYSCCLFVVGREDVTSFQPAKEDQFYIDEMSHLQQVAYLQNVHLSYWFLLSNIV